MSSPPANKESLPIPAELWKRLRRFDRACEIALVRTDSKKDGGGLSAVGYRLSEGTESRTPKADTPPVSPRVWVVTIRRCEGNLFQIVQHVRPTLLEALTLAVDEAEAKGWSG